MIAAAHSVQQWLDFGPSNHFDLIHGRHLHAVASCTKDAASGKWNQRVSPRADARVRLVDLAEAKQANVYMSVSGFDGVRNKRTIESVRALPCAFVDLDYYKDASLADLSPDALLGRIRQSAPWLPMPTLLVASGRGAYLKWVFTAPLSSDHLYRWQAVQDRLIANLGAFGADPMARDGARVLRIAGSLHVDAALTVEARVVGRMIEFAKFERAVLAAPQALQVVQPPKLRLVHSSDDPIEPTFADRAPLFRATAAQKAQFIKPFKLAQDRLSDYEILAELRGSPGLRDCRKRLLFAEAQALTWFASDRDTIHAELRDYAGRHFAGSDRINLDRVQHVITRLDREQAGVVVKMHDGQRVDWRYRLSNRYLIGMLEINRDEQRGLRTVISTSEKQRRRVAKRRAAGMVERAAYEDAAADRRAAALKMRKQGMTQADIAEAIGCTQQAVSLMLKHA